MDIREIVDWARHPLDDQAFMKRCQQTLDRDGALVLDGFILPAALAEMQRESAEGRAEAYFCAQNHSVYLTPPNPDFAEDHPANRQVVSSKGCICDDDVGATSPLRSLYDAPAFRAFVKATTGETSLHPYADPLSSINIHYAERGQSLGGISIIRRSPSRC